MSLPNFHSPEPTQGSPVLGPHYTRARRPPIHPHNVALVAVVAVILVIGVGMTGFVVILGDEDEASGVETEVEADEILEEETTKLEASYADCGELASGIELRDDGFTLIVSRAGADDDPQATFGDVDCVLSSIDLPAFIESHIGQTRAIDGRQEAEFDHFHLGWNYHPDNGLSLTITDTSG